MHCGYIAIHYSYQPSLYLINWFNICIEFYLVQPTPVQFTNQSQDLVFFHGDTISLYCETNCVQLQLSNISCAVGFLYNGLDLEYFEPYEYTVSNERVIGRRTLTIPNANKTANGIYQCFTYSPRFGYLPLTDRVIARPIHVQIAGMIITNVLMIYS